MAPSIVGRWLRRICQAAEFLKLSRTTFRKKAAAGEFTRYGVTDGTYRY